MHTASALLLGYRFAQLDQLRAHLRRFEHGALLFFPATLGAAKGTRVVLEASFDATEQTIILRGEVHAHERGGTPGLWLSLAVPRSLELPPRRKQRRFEADCVVRVTHPDGSSLLARLVDVSLGGARLNGVPRNWKGGETLEIAPVGAERSARAVIHRREGGSLGVTFVRSHPGTRACVDAMLRAAVAAWASAVSVTHPALCRCTVQQAIVDPLLPRAAHRRSA